MIDDYNVYILRRRHSYRLGRNVGRHAQPSGRHGKKVSRKRQTINPLMGKGHSSHTGRTAQRLTQETRDTKTHDSRRDRRRTPVEQTRALKVNDGRINIATTRRLVREDPEVAEEVITKQTRQRASKRDEAHPLGGIGWGMLTQLSRRTRSDIGRGRRAHDGGVGDEARETTRARLRKPDDHVARPLRVVAASPAMRGRLKRGTHTARHGEAGRHPYEGVMRVEVGVVGGRAPALARRSVLPELVKSHTAGTEMRRRNPRRGREGKAKRAVSHHRPVSHGDRIKQVPKRHRHAELSEGNVLKDHRGVTSGEAREGPPWEMQGDVARSETRLVEARRGEVPRRRGDSPPGDVTLGRDTEGGGGVERKARKRRDGEDPIARAHLRARRRRRERQPGKVRCTARSSARKPAAAGPHRHPANRGRPPNRRRPHPTRPDALTPVHHAL